MTHGPPAPVVLAVDHNPRNLQLLVQTLASQGIAILPVPDLARLDAMLAQSCPAGLALVDVDGFDPTIWERCRQLREHDIQVLVLVGRRAMVPVQIESARCGAQAVLSKPLSPRLLAKMVGSLLAKDVLP